MKISIITVNFNDKDGLEDTLRSEVALRTNKNVEKEIIIIDGGSTDGSVDIIKKYEEHISYWCSERDRGIYHAMNRGVAAATGDYCIFMNSRDAFASDDVLERIFQTKAPALMADVITGATYYCDPENGTRELGFPPEKISFAYFYFGSTTLQHQSSFIRTEKLRKYPYDESLKIASDFKFWIQYLVLNGGSYESSNVPVANFDLSGISHHPEAEKRIEKEIKKIYADLHLEKIISDYDLMKNLKMKSLKQALLRKLRNLFNFRNIMSR